MFLFLLDAVFGLHFCIHFQTEAWLVLTICKKDYAFAVFLDDKSKNMPSLNHNQ